MNFNTIPVDLLTPGTYVEFDNSRANSGLIGQRHKALLIGQRLAAGTVAASVPTRITRVGEAQGAFGRSSMLAAMCEAFIAQSPSVELWAVAADDAGAGVAATGTLSFTGPSTAAGTLHLYIAGTYVPVAVASGMTAAQLATAVAAAITADASLPVTAAVDGVNLFEVDITARHKGEVGNTIDLRINYQQGQATPAGIAVTVPTMSGGTTNPTLTAALASIGDAQYLTIAMPYTDATSLTALESELAERWTGLAANDGHGFTAAAGSHGAIGTLGDGRNSPHVTIMGAQGSPTWVPIIAAQVAAADAAEPDPARPRQTLPLKSVLPPSVTARYTRAERNSHLQDGVATFTVDDGGVCRIERLVTTYKTNAQSVADPSYRDVEILRSLSFIRFQVRARISQVYPRHKLADDGNSFAPGQAVATPRGIRGELIALFQDLVNVGVVENIDQFKADLVVERAADDRNRVNVLLPPDLVNQLRVFAAQIQYRL